VGYHRNQHGRNMSRYSEPRGGEGRRTHDGTSGRIRLSPGLIVTALIVWSVPFWGAYLLVDPVLDWLAGSVGPLTDAGTGVARWLGLGQQAAVLSDMANVGGRDRLGGRPAAFHHQGRAPAGLDCRGLRVNCSVGNPEAQVAMVTIIGTSTTIPVRISVHWPTSSMSDATFGLDRPETRQDLRLLFWSGPSSWNAGHQACGKVA